MTPKRTEREIVESLVGRTVVSAEWWEPDGSDKWECGEAATLTLDDGQVVEFGGYGLHTYGGATVTSAPAPS